MSRMFRRFLHVKDVPEVLRLRAWPGGKIIAAGRPVPRGKFAMAVAMLKRCLMMKSTDCVTS
jgi:hypothetical protein